MNTVKLNMGMYRKIKTYDYTEIYKSDYATYVYTALRVMFKTDGIIAVTPKIIFNTLTNKVPSKKDIKGIKEGIEILSKNGIITYEKTSTIYRIDCSNISIVINQDIYFVVPVDYMFKLMQEDNGVKLLHHYIMLCSTINIHEHFGEKSREWIANIIGIKGIKTITEHHKIFVDLNIICFSKRQNGVTKNGTLINLPKLYAMPEYANVIDALCTEDIQKKVKQVEKEDRKAIREAKKEAKEKAEEQKENVKKPCPFGEPTVTRKTNPFENW